MDEEIKYINLQIFGIILTILTSLIALFITYNEKLAKEKKKKFFSNEFVLKLTYLNRFIILIIGILFLYINYKLYEINKEKGNDLTADRLQIMASILVIISSIIAYYVVSLSNTETINDIENPNI